MIVPSLIAVITPVIFGFINPDMLGGLLVGVPVSGGLMAIILSFLRQDTAAIRNDISSHMAMHVQGTFMPSKGAEPKHD